MPRLLIILAVLLSFAAFACGGDSGGDSNGDSTEIFPAPGNSELAVGPNRFALALNLADRTPILDGDVLLRFFFGEELKSELQASFTWAIQDVIGFYVANVEFDTAGQWTVAAVVTLDDGEESSVTFPFPVIEESALPNVGQAAPPSNNPTLATEPNIKRLSTDLDPDLAFYETSIADAMTLGKPAVIVFATPAFCTTQFCGPVLDNAKAVREDYAEDVTFIHVEPFVLDDDGNLVVDEGIPAVAETTTEWRLLTEPWVFIVDADGLISTRFEGAASIEELTAAIEAAGG